MATGVYTIKSLKDNKILVGQSINLFSRLSQHKFHLRNNTHDNRHLQSAYNKYGVDNFEFQILLVCEEEHLYSEENYWCNLLNAHNHKFGYNIKPTHPNGNYRHSEETKLKISQKLKGYKHTEEFKKNCSIRMIGYKKSEKTLEKLRTSCTGKKHTDFTKQKLSTIKKGKSVTFSKKGRASVNKAHKEWLSLGLKNKKIKDALTDIVYDSVMDCIEKLNISTSAFYRNIKGKGKFTNKYKLSYYVKTIK